MKSLALGLLIGILAFVAPIVLLVLALVWLLRHEPQPLHYVQLSQRVIADEPDEAGNDEAAIDAGVRSGRVARFPIP